jgi:hypothetical protein
MGTLRLHKLRLVFPQSQYFQAEIKSVLAYKIATPKALDHCAGSTQLAAAWY